MKEISIADPVFFEGLLHRVMDLTKDWVRFVSDLIHETADGSRPRFETVAVRNDLRWSDELGAWYLWGRVLCKRRGGIGLNERAIVVELRDRGILPARSTRRPGQAPAGGEHMNLCCSLFRQGIQWPQEIDRLRRGEGLSDAAKAAVEDYKKRFREKLVEGYANPDADDSWAEGGA